MEELLTNELNDLARLKEDALLLKDELLNKYDDLEKIKFKSKELDEEINKYNIMMGYVYHLYAKYLYEELESLKSRVDNEKLIESLKQNTPGN